MLFDRRVPCLAMLLAVVFMQLALVFRPAPSDTFQPALSTIYDFLPRVAAASLAAYLISQFHDVWAFQWWRARTGGRHLWLRNCLSTVVSQALDTLVFCLLAFWGVFPWPVLVEIIITTYLMKFLMATLDTPFIYAARRMLGTAGAVDSTSPRS